MLECIYKSIDEKRPFLKIGEETFYNFDLKSNDLVVDENNIKFYQVSDFGDAQYTGYIIVDRYSGNLIQKSAEVPREYLKELLDNDIIKKQSIKQDLETFALIEKITDKFFIENKTSKLSFDEKAYWVEYRLNCKKAKKKF